MFLTQIYGTILGAFVNYGVMIAVVTNQYDLLSGDGNNVVRLLLLSEPLPH